MKKLFLILLLSLSVLSFTSYAERMETDLSHEALFNTKYLKLDTSNDPLTNELDLPGLFNSLGDLKIQPDVQGDTIMFGDTDVGNDTNGKSFYVYRKAAEGDRYIQMYVSSALECEISAQGDGTNDLNIRADDDVNFYPGTSGDMEICDVSGNKNPKIQLNGYLTAISDRRSVDFQVSDTDDYFHLTREDTNILGCSIDMPTLITQNLTLTTAKNFTLGTTQWNSADEIDGTKIKDADYGDVVIDAAGDWQVSEASDLNCTDCINDTEVATNAGTALSADLEEETHASEHAVSGADTVFPADPNADRILQWDDDPGALVFLDYSTWDVTAYTAGDGLTLTGHDIDFDGGDSPGGELGGTWALPTIDDSLIVTGWQMGSSTATTPNADDNDTSLATTAYVQTEINALGGRSLTCASGSCDADAETYTDTKCLYWEDPVDTDDFKSVYIFPTAATITQVFCESDQTVNMTLQEDDGSPGDIESTDFVCDATPPTQTTGFEDAAMAAGSRLDFDVTSVSGTPTWAVICWTFSQDD